MLGNPYKPASDANFLSGFIGGSGKLGVGRWKLRDWVGNEEDGGQIDASSS